VNCFQVFMIFGLWHPTMFCGLLVGRCELLSSFYDLWSLTSDFVKVTGRAALWIAFKFLWSLVFDIGHYSGYFGHMLWIAFKFLWSLVFDIRRVVQPSSWAVVNCFQVFMIFGLWHPIGQRYPTSICCELLSSFYDLWSLTSLFLPRLWMVMVVNCFQVFMIFGLWHHRFQVLRLLQCCELLSSFYDLWSLTSWLWIFRASLQLWIAFKFLWSLVFDIYHHSQ